MVFFSSMARILARTGFVRQAVADRAGLEAFKQPPSVKLIVGVCLIGLSMILGWPAVGALGLLAAYLGDPMVVLIGGPAIYGFSWLIWGAGMLIAGPDNIKYAKAFLRWSARTWVERFLPELAASPGYGSNHAAGRSTKKSN